MLLMGLLISEQLCKGAAIANFPFRMKHTQSRGAKRTRQSQQCTLTVAFILLRAFSPSHPSHEVSVECWHRNKILLAILLINESVQIVLLCLIYKPNRDDHFPPPREFVQNTPPLQHYKLTSAHTSTSSPTSHQTVISDTQPPMQSPVSPPITHM